MLPLLLPPPLTLTSYLIYTLALAIYFYLLSSFFTKPKL
jgi:hypothetical protein